LPRLFAPQGSLRQHERPTIKRDLPIGSFKRSNYSNLVAGGV
jgi:hypothetical protein